MLLWFLIVISVNVNGTVDATIKYTNDYQYNNKSSCEQAGDAISRVWQTERGTSNSKLFYMCRSVEFNAIEKMLPPKI